MTTDEIEKILGSKYGAIAADGALALGQLDLTAGAKVLDVGTGLGNFAIFLATQGFQVTTGEPADDVSPYAKRNWSESAEKIGVRDRIAFEHLEAHALPFAPGAFAAVFFFGVLHHVAESDRRAAVAEALRVVGPAGTVVFFEPTKATLDKLWVDDPDHPLAADPMLYRPEGGLDARCLQGQMMDILICRSPTPK